MSSSGLRSDHRYPIAPFDSLLWDKDRWGSSRRVPHRGGRMPATAQEAKKRHHERSAARPSHSHTDHRRLRRRAASHGRAVHCRNGLGDLSICRDRRSAIHDPVESIAGESRQKLCIGFHIESDPLRRRKPLAPLFGIKTDDRWNKLLQRA